MNLLASVKVGSLSIDCVGRNGNFIAFLLSVVGNSVDRSRPQGNWTDSVGNCAIGRGRSEYVYFRARRSFWYFRWVHSSPRLADLVPSEVGSSSIIG